MITTIINCATCKREVQCRVIGTLLVKNECGSCFIARTASKAQPVRRRMRRTPTPKARTRRAKTDPRDKLRAITQRLLTDKTLSKMQRAGLKAARTRLMNVAQATLPFEEN